MLERGHVRGEERVDEARREGVLAGVRVDPQPAVVLQHLDVDEHLGRLGHAVDPLAERPGDVRRDPVAVAVAVADAGLVADADRAREHHGHRRHGRAREARALPQDPRGGGLAVVEVAGEALLQPAGRCRRRARGTVVEQGQRGEVADQARHVGMHVAPVEERQRHGEVALPGPAGEHVAVRGRQHARGREPGRPAAVAERGPPRGVEAVRAAREARGRSRGGERQSRGVGHPGEAPPPVLLVGAQPLRVRPGLQHAVPEGQLGGRGRERQPAHEEVELGVQDHDRQRVDDGVVDADRDARADPAAAVRVAQRVDVEQRPDGEVVPAVRRALPEPREGGVHRVRIRVGRHVAHVDAHARHLLEHALGAVGADHRAQRRVPADELVEPGGEQVEVLARAVELGVVVRTHAAERDARVAADRRTRAARR